MWLLVNHFQRLIWIPSHIGIRDQLADEAAKSALNLSMSAVKCPATDLYSQVANHCQRLWQADWDGCVSNKLLSVKLGRMCLKQITLCQTFPRL